MGLYLKLSKKQDIPRYFRVNSVVMKKASPQSRPSTATAWSAPDRPETGDDGAIRGA